MGGWWPAGEAPGHGYGLDSAAAREIAEIIKDMTGVDGVAIADRAGLLGVAGLTCPRHEPELGLADPVVRRALASGELMVVSGEQARPRDCRAGECPCRFQAAMVAPLQHRGQLWGAVKLYRLHGEFAPDFVPRIVTGITNLLNLQIERVELGLQRQWAMAARLEALQAQIRPHFLFNTLNTILSTLHADPARAAELIVLLGQFFRHSLSQRGAFAPLREELAYVQQYLRLEEARFGDRLRTRLEVDPAALEAVVPVLTLQPLVENAVIHGISPKEEGGRISVRVRRCGEEVRMAVADTGVGMEPAARARVMAQRPGQGTGLGLNNINDRLRTLFGRRYRLRIWSRPGRGTLALVRIPAAAGKEVMAGEPAAGAHCG